MILDCSLYPSGAANSPTLLGLHGEGGVEFIFLCGYKMVQPFLVFCHSARQRPAVGDGGGYRNCEKHL